MCCKLFHFFLAGNSVDADSSAAVAMVVHNTVCGWFTTLGRWSEFERTLRLSLDLLKDAQRNAGRFRAKRRACWLKLTPLCEALLLHNNIL